MMNQELKQSLDKYNTKLHERLVLHLSTVIAGDDNSFNEDSPEARQRAFMELLWRQCGFCTEFYETIPYNNHKCNTCPLYEDKICNASWINIPNASPLHVMRKAFMNDDTIKFNKTRKKFVNIMLSHKNRFPKEVI